MGCTLHRFKGLLDNVLSGLSQHLNGNIRGDHISLDQGADKIIFRVGGCRESHFDFLKSDVYQHLEKL